jgi:hypothetical protein
MEERLNSSNRFKRFGVGRSLTHKTETVHGSQWFWLVMTRAKAAV